MLQVHFSANNHLDQYLSGFRSGHRTETALLKIANDILVSADSGCLTVLILFYLTAAFDTVSHHILISRLSAIGITGTAMSWFISYLSDRLSFISVQSLNHCLFLSLKVSLTALFLDLLCPTFIGFLLVILFLATVSAIVIVMLMTCKCTYQVAPPLPFNSLNACIADIKIWLHSNFLKLNYKSELIVFVPPSHLKKSLN